MENEVEQKKKSNVKAKASPAKSGRVFVGLKVDPAELDDFKSTTGCRKNATAIMALARKGNERERKRG